MVSDHRPCDKQAWRQGQLHIDKEYLDLSIRSDPLDHMGERTQRMIGSVDGYEQPLFVRHGELPSRSLDGEECHFSSGTISGNIPMVFALARLLLRSADAHCQRPAVYRMLELMYAGNPSRDADSEVSPEAIWVVPVGNCARNGVPFSALAIRLCHYVVRDPRVRQLACVSSIPSAIRSISKRRRNLYDHCTNVCGDSAGALAVRADRRRVGLRLSIVGSIACREDPGPPRDHSPDPLVRRAAAGAIGSLLCRTLRLRHADYYLGSNVDPPDHCVGRRRW